MSDLLIDLEVLPQVKPLGEILESMSDEVLAALEKSNIERQAIMDQLTEQVAKLPARKQRAFEAILLRHVSEVVSKFRLMLSDRP